MSSILMVFCVLSLMPILGRPGAEREWAMARYAPDLAHMRTFMATHEDMHARFAHMMGVLKWS